MACIALTIATVIVLIVAAGAWLMVSIVRRLNASSIKGDEDWRLPPGDMLDPHRRHP